MSKELSVIDFNDEQITLIKTQIAKDCNQAEFKLFLYQCKQTGLNPLTKQIYAIKRGGKMTIQTSIDGFRVIAERSGLYAGQDEPVWEEDDKGNIIKCTVKIYKFTPNYEQRYCAGVGVAYFKEYYPNPINLQKSMPRTMIAKTAEAIALRKAFPQDLSGLYTNDEIHEESEMADITPKSDIQKLGAIAEDDMKDMRGQMNKDSAEKIKKELRNCETLAEIAHVKSTYLKEINQLKKYAEELFEEICIVGADVKKEIEEDNGNFDDSNKLAQI